MKKLCVLLAAIMLVSLAAIPAFAAVGGQKNDFKPIEAILTPLDDQTIHVGDDGGDDVSSSTDDLGDATVTPAPTDGDVTADVGVPKQTPELSDAILYGDANGDDKVNAKDVTIIMKSLVSGDQSRIIFVNSDVNLDESVNAKDVTAIMKYLAGVSTVRLGHNDKLEVITPSTCTKSGTGRLVCKICGDTQTVSLPLAEHTYFSSVTKEPTCTAKGVITNRCSVCGASYTESIRANGHNFFNDTCLTCGKGFAGWEERYFYDAFDDITDERYIISYDYDADYHTASGDEAIAGIDFLVEGRNGAYQVSFNIYIWIDSDWFEVQNDDWVGGDYYYDLYLTTSGGEIYMVDAVMAAGGTNRVYVEDYSQAQIIVDAIRSGNVTEFALTDKGSSDFDNYVLFSINRGDFLDALNFLG